MKRDAGRGFTLIEVAVALAICGAVLLIVYPRTSLFDRHVLMSDARRVASMVRFLNEASTARKIYLRVAIRPGEGSFSVESSGDGVEFRPATDPVFSSLTLSNGGVVEDVIVQGIGRVAGGEALLVFNPGAGAEPFEVRIKRGAMVAVIGYNPFSGAVKISGDDA